MWGGGKIARRLRLRRGEAGAGLRYSLSGEANQRHFCWLRERAKADRGP